MLLVVCRRLQTFVNLKKVNVAFFVEADQLSMSYHLFLFFSYSFLFRSSLQALLLKISLFIDFYCLRRYTCWINSHSNKWYIIVHKRIGWKQRYRKTKQRLHVSENIH